MIKKIAVAGLAALFACSVQAQSRIKLTAAGNGFPNTIGEKHWRSFESSVNERAGDQFDVRMLIYGQLGSEEQLVSGLRRGRIQYANLSATVASTVVPETSLLYAPYLFDSETEADFVYDNYLTDFFRTLLVEGGLHLVAFNEIGFHHVYSKQPVLMPDDARGRRFRISASPAARMFAEAVGADLIPLGFGEIVASLQTGLIEAGENSVALYARTGTADEAPHLTLTAHSFGMSLIVARHRWWRRLTDEQREILTSAFPSIQQTRKDVREEANGDLAAAKSMGFVVHELSAEEREAWKGVTQGTHQRLIEEIGGRSQEVYDLIQEGKAAFKASVNP